MLLVCFEQWKVEDLNQISVCPFFFSQIGALQNRLRDSHVSTQDHHDILKSELARRDETIQKLRQDVLILQEKRDNAVSEVSSWEPRLTPYMYQGHVLCYILQNVVLLCIDQHSGGNIYLHLCHMHSGMVEVNEILPSWDK